MTMLEIEAYTDGACAHRFEGAAGQHVGSGGWAAVLMLPHGRRELFGGCFNTTANRMELYAALVAIHASPDQATVILHSDSQYVTRGVLQCAEWARNGWLTSRGKPIADRDLWEAYLRVSATRLVSPIWLKGHAGFAGNELADRLSRLGVGREHADNGLDVNPECPSKSILVNHPTYGNY